MDRQLERCCGLDVHKETIAACVRLGGRSGHATQQVQTFRTTAADLVVLHDWLAAQGVTHVAMESTGVYWKPVFYALESDFTCLLVNAAHIKQVPGRKTDVQDCVGSPRCWSMGCGGAASCRRCRSASSATSRATARR
jgi:transposase